MKLTNEEIQKVKKIISNTGIQPKSDTETKPSTDYSLKTMTEDISFYIKWEC
jgi:hypothetical protein